MERIPQDHIRYVCTTHLEVTANAREEPFDAFTEEDGQAPLVSECVVVSDDADCRFWKAVGKDIPVGRKEPGGKLGEIHEAPKETLSV